MFLTSFNFDYSLNYLKNPEKHEEKGAFALNNHKPKSQTKFLNLI